ncbi:DUF2892 domain-containing protein [Acetobacteraceae bacterium]|nr:DUF2892 domain-containing protein [Acetobacteraceae bacterium]
MALKFISVEEARRLIDERVTVVDIRDAIEFDGEHIARALNIPTENLSWSEFQGRPVLFYCQTGKRTKINSAVLALISPYGYVLEGGLDAWKKAKLPVIKGGNRQSSVMRQIYVMSGALVFIGSLLGGVKSRKFFLLPALIGAGMFGTGVTGKCGLTHFLMKMSWNRPPAQNSKEE